jgi:hypothetical protein
MARDHVSDPYDPHRQGTAAYGHNHEGALVQGLILSLIELAVVYLILRPGSYHKSWARAALALVLYVPWTAVSMVMTMHAGGIFTLHFFWLAVLVLILGICLSVSGLGALLSRRAQPQN